ncbi:plasminogen activator inhibitor 1-like [Planococcus citri]|uniref:plasminogen activator inhibitor 1-like n=1 Tax=Planococcus citri TaxID=170843 RepID=UPI0031F7E6C3
MKDEVALFIQKEYPIQVAFMNRIARLCNANVKRLDFKKGGKEPEIAVNKWASDYSANKIKKITQLPINQTTTFLAIGISYFNNGDWKYPFLETRQQLFFATGTNGEKIDIRVEMMFGRAPIPYYEDKEADYRAIILPYKNKSTHMYVLLPGQENWVGGLISSLLEKDFTKNITEKSTITEVSYGIPKMHLEMTINIKSVLQYWGYGTLFDPVSDNFSKITDKQIHVSEILQKVVIDVNEKAGDVTTNIGTTTSSSHINNDKYIDFTADRPFIFFIYDAKAKVMTFWGSVLRPTPYGGEADGGVWRVETPPLAQSYC